jgi:hypothetical protein
MSNIYIKKQIPHPPGEDGDYYIIVLLYKKIHWLLSSEEVN